MPGTLAWRTCSFRRYSMVKVHNGVLHCFFPIVAARWRHRVMVAYSRGWSWRLRHLCWNRPPLIWEKSWNTWEANSMSMASIPRLYRSYLMDVILYLRMRFLQNQRSKCAHDEDYTMVLHALSLTHDNGASRLYITWLEWLQFDVRPFWKTRIWYSNETYFIDKGTLYMYRVTLEWLWSMRDKLENVARYRQWTCLSWQKGGFKAKIEPAFLIKGAFGVWGCHSSIEHCGCRLTVAQYIKTWPWRNVYWKQKSMLWILKNRTQLGGASLASFESEFWALSIAVTKLRSQDEVMTILVEEVVTN